MTQEIKATPDGQVIELEGCSSDELMLLAAVAASRLGWKVDSVKHRQSEFYTPASRWANGETVEKVTLSRIEGKEGQLLARSEAVSGVAVKDKANLEKLVETMGMVNGERKDNPSVLAAFGFSDDKENGKEAEEDDFFRSLMDVRKKCPATFSLLCINVAWFVGVWLWSTCRGEPMALSRIKWGLNFAPLTLTGDWWRTLTGSFVHLGIWDLLVNMVVLLLYGCLLEPALGSRKVAAAYFLTGLYSAWVYLFVHPVGIGLAGAFGPAFGLFGVFLAWLLCSREVGASKKNEILSTSVGVAAFVLMRKFKAGADIAECVGGLASGFLLGLVYAITRKHKLIAFAFEAVFVLVFVIFFCALAELMVSSIDLLQEIRQDWEDGTFENAMRRAVQGGGGQKGGR